MRIKLSLLIFLSFTQILLLEAKADPAKKLDGLSGTPSRHKPSKDLLCGTNGAWAMSAPTITSIYRNLGKNLGFTQADIRTLCAEDKRVQDKMRDRFGPEPVVCKVTLEPSGRVKQIDVKKS